MLESHTRVILEMVGMLKFPMIERVAEPIIPVSADTLRLPFFPPPKVFTDAVFVLYNLHNQTGRCMEGDMTVYKPCSYSIPEVILT
jgi:hypothetical protein